MTRGVYAHIALLAFLALLFSGLALAMLLKPLEREAIASRESPWQLSMPSPITLPPEDMSSSLARILARPLFSKTRKPFEEPPPPVATASQPAEPPVQVTPAETLMLKGIFLGPRLSKALIATPANPLGIWVVLGAEIEGWKVEAITRADVRLVQERQRAVLSLYRQEAVQ
jgi:hypothetical protein